MMKELVGTCVFCDKNLYCVDGFFQGQIVNNQNLCFACFEQNKKESAE